MRFLGFCFTPPKRSLIRRLTLFWFFFRRRDFSPSFYIVDTFSSDLVVRSFPEFFPPLTSREDMLVTFHRCSTLTVDVPHFHPISGSPGFKRSAVHVEEEPHFNTLRKAGKLIHRPYIVADCSFEERLRILPFFLSVPGIDERLSFCLKRCNYRLFEEEHDTEGSYLFFDA